MGPPVLFTGGARRTLKHFKLLHHFFLGNVRANNSLISRLFLSKTPPTLCDSRTPPANTISFRRVANQSKKNSLAQRSSTWRASQAKRRIDFWCCSRFDSDLSETPARTGSFAMGWDVTRARKSEEALRIRRRRAAAAPLGPGLILITLGEMDGTISDINARGRGRGCWATPAQASSRPP